jgi:hypothetical protein
MVDRPGGQFPLEESLSVSDNAIVGVRVPDVDAEQHGGSNVKEERRVKMESEQSKANWRISKEPGRFSIAAPASGSRSHMPASAWSPKFHQPNPLQSAKPDPFRIASRNEPP